LSLSSKAERSPDQQPFRRERKPNGTRFQDCGVTSSISPCEGDGSGANPGFLTIFRGSQDWFIASSSQRRLCSVEMTERFKNAKEESKAGGGENLRPHFMIM
jgi:hypothetical protein